MIKKKIKNVGIAFEILEEEETLLSDWKKVLKRHKEYSFGFFCGKCTFV